jgi:hypothetical protein
VTKEIFVPFTIVESSCCLSIDELAERCCTAEYGRPFVLTFFVCGTMAEAGLRVIVFAKTFTFEDNGLAVKLFDL